MIDITSTHAELVSKLITCEPGSERARELRAMIQRLERIFPPLEYQRTEAMHQRLEQDLMNSTTMFPKVTLKDDAAFVGYLIARYVDDDGQNTNDYCVAVSKPGSTTLRGDVRLPGDRIEVIG